MAEKDIAEKILEDYPDIFADIVNGLLFQGREVIKPEELEDTKLRSAYKAEGKLHEMERDVAKRWKENGIRIACIGFENQSSTDADMVLRVYGYDGAEYRAQCLKENAGKPRYPVVTLVLHLLKVMEHDDRFYEDELLNAVARGEVKNMCKVLDQIENRGVENERERVATDMLKEKMPIEMIKRISKLSEEHIRKLAKSLGVAVL